MIQHFNAPHVVSIDWYTGSYIHSCVFVLLWHHEYKIISFHMIIYMYTYTINTPLKYTCMFCTKYTYMYYTYTHTHCTIYWYMYKYTHTHCTIYIHTICTHIHIIQYTGTYYTYCTERTYTEVYVPYNIHTYHTYIHVHVLYVHTYTLYNNYTCIYILNTHCTIIIHVHTKPYTYTYLTS